jgi:hypothetical protein
MATDTAGGVGQEYPQNMVHYISKTIGFADDDLVVTVGWLPPNAVVVDCGVAVTTAFSANSVLDIGTAADPDAYASAIVMTTAGCIRDVSTVPLLSHDDTGTVDTKIVASLTSSGAISAGVGHVFVYYIVPNR